VSLSGKHNTLKPGNHISTSMSSALDVLTQNSIGSNVFLPRVVYICDMVTLGEKSNILKPQNHISNSISSAFDFKSIGNIFLPWVVYMCDMVTLGGKDNGLEPGNRISYFEVQCT
jgi:hypothetical protein